MFGNLFGANKPKDLDPMAPPEPPQSDTQILPGQYNPGGNSVSSLQSTPPGQGPQMGQQGMTPQPQQGSGVFGSRMDPAMRQNLSALSHLDQRTTQVLLHSQEETKRIHQQMIEPEQVLIGLLYDEGIFKLLEDFAIDVAGLLREVQSKEAAGKFTAQPMLSNDSQQLFEKAFLEAKKRDAAFVTPEDVLMTLLASNNKAAGYLNSKGIKKEKLEEKLTKSTEYNYGKKSVLDKFGMDLTQEAREGKLDPIAGRDKEIERMIHILLRRTKNNPVIIGEAGVGKTAIVEGLAQAIAAGTVPEALKNKRIIQLDMASLVAGASHRGEFEERLKGVINEAMASSGQLVLFVDEIHTVMGAGDEGTMDASNIIKPHLARGKLQIIGATTTSEYRKNFEKDKAFERRFQPILVEEPSEEDAIKMLQVLRPKFEKFHQVTITDEALESAVKLSKKYIGERYLPDKAIDLLDEASAEVKLAHSEGHGMTYTSQNQQDTVQARLAKDKDKGNKAEVIDDQGNVVTEAKDEAATKDGKADASAGKSPDGKDGENKDKAAQGQAQQPADQNVNGVSPMPGQQPTDAMSGQMPQMQQPGGATPETMVDSGPFGKNGIQPGVQPGRPYQSFAVSDNPFGAPPIPMGQQQNPQGQNGMPMQQGGQPMGQNSAMPDPNNPFASFMQQGQQMGQPGQMPDQQNQMNQQGQPGQNDSSAPQDPNAKPDEEKKMDGQPGQEGQENDPNKKPGDPSADMSHDASVKSSVEVKKVDIENVVSNWTGIPITKLTEDESEKLLKLEDRIHQRLIDQEEAVKAVSEAVRRGRIGLASGNRPIASFIFLGPTGTGKTELAKTLAEILFGKDDAMVRLDMSEYMEKHEVAKLIGAPPGYVGYEEGGQLTEAVRAKPYSIVLLDEVEKAHPDVFNILLQLLEDGRVTDNKGNTISFKNTIVICTSNIGSALITQTLSEKDQKVKKTPEQEEKDFKELSGQITEELRKFFRPELLNRFDDTVIFKPLRRQDMSKIAKLGLDKTAKLLKDQGFAVQVTQKALAQLATEGYDPVYGARPLRRLIQTSVENPIALAIISKKFALGDTIIIDYDATASEYAFRQGVKKVEAKDDKTQEGDQSGLPGQEGQTVGQNPADPNQPAPDGMQGMQMGPNGQQAVAQPDYPDWVKQAMAQNGQGNGMDPNGQPMMNGMNQGQPMPGQPGGMGMAQQMPGGAGFDQQQPGMMPGQQPQPSLVDQMTQPQVEAPFDPLALVGSTPPPTSGMPTGGTDGTQMQKAG